MIICGCYYLFMSDFVDGDINLIDSLFESIDISVIYIKYSTLNIGYLC